MEYIEKKMNSDEKSDSGQKNLPPQQPAPSQTSQSKFQESYSAQYCDQARINIRFNLELSERKKSQKS